MDIETAFGSIFNIQRFSLNDGPGIRTVVFLKGCPMHCPWCSNPESQDAVPVVFYNPDRCVACGVCASVCPESAVDPTCFGTERILRTKCTGCGACAEACSTQALSLWGKRVSVWELYEEVAKDITVFRDSGGGITLSGGEPLLQSAFSRDLLRLCRMQGISTAMETTGYAPRDALVNVLPYVDTFLYDIKHFDAMIHRSVIGVDNACILANLQFLRSRGANVILRLPLIPDFNATRAHLEHAFAQAESLGIEEVHVLPYHIYGESKYAFLGKTYAMQIQPMEDAEALDLIAQCAVHGRKVKLHG